MDPVKTKRQLQRELGQIVESVERVLTLLGYPSIYIARMFVKRTVPFPGTLLWVGRSVLKGVRKVGFAEDRLVRLILSFLPNNVERTITTTQRNAIARQVIDPLLDTPRGTRFLSHLFDGTNGVMNANRAGSMNTIIMPILDILTLDQVSQTVSFIRERIRAGLLGTAPLQSHVLSPERPTRGRHN